MQSGTVATNLPTTDIPQVALGTFKAEDGGLSFPGLLLGEHVVPLAEIPGCETLKNGDLLPLLDRWGELRPAIERFCNSFDPQTIASMPVEALWPQLPLTPRQIVCVGANYRRHVIEMMADHDVGSEAGLSREERLKNATRLMDHRASHGQPFVFIKPQSALLAPSEPLLVPPDSTQVDWELELAVVIGRPCFRVSRRDAADYIAGYTIANDISARDRLSRRDIPGIGLDLVCGKAAPGFFPLGPYIVPSSHVDRPQDLVLDMRLNGQVMQHESTADMIFPIDVLVEFISTHMKLLPGDIISTGSPAGNGTHFNRFLQDGDTVEGRIEGLGLQRFACIAEEPHANAPVHRPFVPLENAQT